MPTLRDIKRHITSVESIAKITNALEAVAMSRIGRLTARAQATRPFATRSWTVLNHLAATAAAQLAGNPVFCGHDAVERIGLLVISSDKGMVGSFNSDIVAHAVGYAEQQTVPVDVIALGRIGRESMLGRGYPVHADFASTESPETAEISSVAQVLLQGFGGRSFQEVVMVFATGGRGTPIHPLTRPLLPLRPSEGEVHREYIYEPDPEELLRGLLPRIIRFQVFQAHLESLIAENMSRRMAMRTATLNANDLIGDLSRSYNKARQENITAEMVDLLGGSATAALA